MIDLRHGYALAIKVGEHYYFATDHRPSSTRVILSAYVGPVREEYRRKTEAGISGLCVVQIRDNTITEVSPHGT